MLKYAYVFSMLIALSVSSANGTDRREIAPYTPPVGFITPPIGAEFPPIGLKSEVDPIYFLMPPLFSTPPIG
jgi:hypothetical protein